jgi:antitoxin (DNA-binding transcriptional repressor) of toxin-antitoxin stability system
VTVTDHGEPVARIVPIGVPSALERLIADGRIQPAATRKRSAPKPIKAAGTVTDLVDQQRR